HFRASSFARSGGASAAITGTSRVPSRWVVPQATYRYPAAWMPDNARSSENREYGSVMQAVWDRYGAPRGLAGTTAAGARPAGGGRGGGGGGGGGGGAGRTSVQDRQPGGRPRQPGASAEPTGGFIVRWMGHGSSFRDSIIPVGSRWYRPRHQTARIKGPIRVG